MNSPIPTEILEAILLHLPNRDLLLAQRVNRAWRDTITTSPALQQKLFLQPVSGPFTRHTKIQHNPLLHLILPPFYRQLDRSVVSHRDDPWQPQFTLPGSHDDGHAVFADDVVLDRLWYENYEGGYHGHATTEAVEWLKSRGRRFLREEASWRRMFAVQPPARTLLVADDECCDCCGKIMIHRSRGRCDDAALSKRVNLGVLYDLVLDYVEDFTGNMCSVEWFVDPKGRDGEGGGEGWLEPVVIVRNVTWRSCSAPAGELRESGVKVKDPDVNLVSWDEAKFHDFVEWDLGWGDGEAGDQDAESEEDEDDGISEGGVLSDGDANGEGVGN